MNRLTITDAEPVAHLPSDHLAKVRKLIRAADAYRSACTCLETMEADFRQFRTVASLDRVNVSEARVRRCRDDLDAAIEALRDSANEGGNA